MEKKYLEKFQKDKVRVKLNLKNGKFYTGVIIELSENTVLFLDKFGNELPFSLDSISYVDKTERNEVENDGFN